jgi:hypothetical protein
MTKTTTKATAAAKEWRLTGYPLFNRLRITAKERLFGHNGYAGVLPQSLIQVFNVLAYNALDFAFSEVLGRRLRISTDRSEDKDPLPKMFSSARHRLFPA